MRRSLLLLALLATACMPSRQFLAPRNKMIRPPKTPHVTTALNALQPLQHYRMPVVVPDTEHLEPMPVVRPDVTNDREMAVRGFGSVAMVRLRGPAKVIPAKPLSDSVLHVVSPR